MKLKEYIDSLAIDDIADERKEVLNALVDYINEKRQANEAIHLNFICTHNSRRSHLCQVWAQTMASHFAIENVTCYSGGTEATAVYPMIISVLKSIGFEVEKTSDDENPTYMLEIDQSNSLALFSKTFDHQDNPTSNFAAVMTCSDADANCPFIPNAKRISITYEDPKKFDGTSIQEAMYKERSNQIATEMAFVFSNVN